MHSHLLFDHPLFDERPIKEILEPFGFEVHLEIVETPDPDEQPEEAAAFERDGQAYIDGLTFEHPAGFTEIYRGDNEDSEIFSVAVRAKTVFAQLLLCADSSFAGRESALSPSYLDVYHERMRQLTTEGFSREHDDKYCDGELPRAAACYAAHASALNRIGVSREAYSSSAPNREIGWPWPRSWWKPTDPRRDLVKAGALILAEIERLDRAAARQGGEA